MLTGLLLTIGSLFFAILLLIVYYSKHRFLSIRNKVYRYLLIVAIIHTLAEFVTVFCAYYFENLFINLIAFRIQWLSGIVWAALLYYYGITFMCNIKAKNLIDLFKYNKSTKLLTSLFVIFIFLYFFIPFTDMSLDKVSYVPGAAAYYVLFVFTITIFAILIFTIKYGKKATLRNKLSSIFMLVETIIIFILQMNFKYIGLYSIGMIFQDYFLYFVVENPDLKIIKELEELKDEIERSNKAKSEFLFNMSHEIRTPMNAIVGFSETLLNDPNYNEKRARTDIKHIASAGNNLLDIVNNILDISKIESGRDTIEEKEYSLGNIIMELSSIIDARIANKPVKLIMDVDPDIPSRLYGDSTKVFQILLNILTNSVKYTEVGKIKLTVTKNLTKTGYVDLHFKITDTGYGIKKEDYDKLFLKFSRLDTAKSNEIEGTGLGLVITKKYVELLGGTITFDSEYEVGTTFYVNLSQKIVNYSKLGNVTEPINTETHSEFEDYSNYKVLVVDDNKLNLKVATRILEKYGIKVDTLSSGKECVFKIKEGAKYDMIFLDHMMPEMDGIETLHILKKIDGYDIPPIIVLTANAITGMREMYLKEGFNEYLSKPININDLNKILVKYLKK